MKQTGETPAYICGRYARTGKQACGTHYIKVYAIEALIMSDIRSMLDLIVDEDNARKVFLERKAVLYKKQTDEDRKKLRTANHRLSELTKLIQAVYEDKVLCRVPEDVCINLLETYQHEQTVLKAEVEEITKRAETEKQDERDVDEFIKRLKKYADVSVLTREMALELIEYVTVDDNPRSPKIPREIHIYYKLLDKGLSDKSNALI